MKDILYVYELHIKYDKYAEEVLLFLALVSQPNVIVLNSFCTFQKILVN